MFLPKKWQPLAKSTAASLWFWIIHLSSGQTGKTSGMSWNKPVNLSYRCLFPIFGQPLLTASVWRRERPADEHHARRLPSWVSSRSQPGRDALWVGADLLLRLLCVQDAAGRRNGLPDAGLVRLGEHILRHRLPVWTLGPGCLAVFPDWSVTQLITGFIFSSLTCLTGLREISFLLLTGFVFCQDQGRKVLLLIGLKRFSWIFIRLIRMKTFDCGLTATPDLICVE